MKTKVQFNIRFLLLSTLAIAVFLAIVQLIVREAPQYKILGFFAVTGLALYGMAFVCVACFLALAILLAGERESFYENMVRCFGLGCVGCAAIVAAVIWVVLLGI